MSTYFCILTSLGAAKMANATALGEVVEFSQMALGDGGGSLPTPDQSQTSLVNEVRRAALNSVEIDPDNPTWIVCEQVIPAETGGWTIRETGIYDTDGDLIAVGNFPETYKPVLEEGSGRTQTIRMVIQVSNAATVTLKIDPSVVLATREYVDKSSDEHLEEAKSYSEDAGNLKSGQVAIDRLPVGALLPFGTKSDFLNGALFVTDIPVAADTAQSFTFDITGKVYSSVLHPLSLVVQGYINQSAGLGDNYENISNFKAVDRNRSFVDRSVKIRTYGGFLALWLPRGSYWQSYDAVCFTTTIGGSRVNRIVSVQDVPIGSASKVGCWADFEMEYPFRGVNDVGMIVSFPALTAPEGFLKLSGGELSRAIYSELYSFALSSGNMAVSEEVKFLGQFGPGDGVSTFTLPDPQGMTVRVLDEVGFFDAGREIGSYQEDAIRNLYGTISGISESFAISGGADGVFSKVSVGGSNTPATSDSNSIDGVVFDASTQVPTAPENRVKSIAWPLYIRYRG